MKRRQLPMPAEARAALARVPQHFTDDGCSNSPDSWFGFDFRWACRLHDHAYCTRANPAGSMTWGAKVVADEMLKQRIRSALPLRWRWVRYIYKAAVFWGGGYGSWDSCGDEPPNGASELQRRNGLCRHAMPRPEWMV